MSASPWSIIGSNPPKFQVGRISVVNRVKVSGYAMLIKSFLDVDYMIFYPDLERPFSPPHVLEPTAAFQRIDGTLGVASNEIFDFIMGTIAG